MSVDSLDHALDTALEAVRLLDADGGPVAHTRYAAPPDDVPLQRYRAMVLGRRLDDQAG
ncbi:MAG: pyruvate dehydrogenase (acetyl-transferring) E1 component subunit alpha, partial [Actinotalea sp.]|nr:pyruvate dehydrogenase (acetyl-transferring) E1 component subunit alpha [Actinotalea sp.]